MANLIKNGEGTTLVDWSSTNTTIDNGFKISNGKMLQSMILTDEIKSSKYKLSYNCKALRSTNSYFLLTVGLSTGGYNTYFLPIQFAGQVEISFDMNTDAQNIIFEVVGNLTISDVVMNIDSELSPQDKINLLKLNQNSTKWDAVIENVSSTGKFNSEMLEGIINTTLNRFANTSGTISQENGEMIFLNGTTVANSTAAMKLSSAGLLIADTKNADGSWHWDTAVTGAGISASAIVTGVLSAITISGVDITASSMTGGTITGVVIEGSVIYSGDRTNGNYMKIENGLITVYKANQRVFVVNESGGVDMWADNETQWLTFKPREMFGGRSYSSIRVAGGSQGLRLARATSYIHIEEDGTISIQGDVHINGDLNVNGHVTAANVG